MTRFKLASVPLCCVAFPCPLCSAMWAVVAELGLHQLRYHPRDIIEKTPKGS